MIILRGYKSVVFWLIFMSLWIIGCDTCCKEKKVDETEKKVNTSKNNGEENKINNLGKLNEEEIQSNKIKNEQRIQELYLNENNKKNEGYEKNGNENNEENEEYENSEKNDSDKVNENNINIFNNTILKNSIGDINGNINSQCTWTRFKITITTYGKDSKIDLGIRDLEIRDIVNEEYIQDSNAGDSDVDFIVEKTGGNANNNNINEENIINNKIKYLINKIHFSELH